MFVKSLLNVIKYAILTILIILAIIFVSVFIETKINPNKIPSIFEYKPFIVLSGSMEKEIYKGDLAIVKNVKPNELKENDIIAFRDEDGYVVTHRIVEIINNNGTKEFVTKGDNNNIEDDGTVSLDRVEGKYINKINGLGNVLLVMQKPLTLCIVLVLIIAMGILWIVIDNNKLSIDERKELELLRKEKQSNN